MATKTFFALLAVAALVPSWAGREAGPDANPENGVVLIELPESRRAGIVLAFRQVEDQKEVLILTAYYEVLQEFVKNQQQEVPVRFYGSPTRFRAEIVDQWIDMDEDLALILVRDRNVPSTIRPLPLGDVDSVSRQSPVVAIGHRVSGGKEEWRSDDGKVTQPVGLRITFSGSWSDRGFLGSPLLNSQGEVVGLVTDVSTTGNLGNAKNVDLVRGFLRGKRIEVPYLAAVPPGLNVRRNPKDGLKYVWIPPGRFMMGCSPDDKECSDDEKPPHQVTITKGFWIGQTAVTVGAYKRFVAVEGLDVEPRSGYGLANDSSLPVENLPVVGATWNEAQDYCKWAAKRLPTEAEWEYAARGGSTGVTYGPLDEIAWHAGNIGFSSSPHQGGEKKPNEFGLYDMLGNVWEWVNDWYDPTYYSNSPTQDPTGPAIGSLINFPVGGALQCRVLRGGLFSDEPKDAPKDAPKPVRVSARDMREPTDSGSDFGFRCASDMPPH